MVLPTITIQPYSTSLQIGENMRKLFTSLSISVVLFCATIANVPLRVDISSTAQAQDSSGLVTVTSASDVESTVERLVNNLEARGLTVMRVIDHAANAAGVDLELRPTQVILFGNPNLGTQLMNNSRSVAIDLPQKYLVWEDGDGQTHVAYNGVPYLVDRHGLTGPEEVLTTVTNALANFANSITTPVEPPDSLPETGGSTSSMMSLWIALFGLLMFGLLTLLPQLRGQRQMRFWFIIITISLTSSLIFIPQQSQADGHGGLVDTISSGDMSYTLETLQAAIEDANLRVMMVIDHAANAARVERELPPTSLILFGNPMVGTQLMQSNQTIGIDLPQKMAVWEDADGLVHVTYNDPVYLGARHGITDKDELLARVSGVLSSIVESVAASE